MIRTNFYVEKYDDTKPGYLVMTTSCEIGHSVFKQGLVDRDYLVFGCNVLLYVPLLIHRYGR